MDEFKGDLREIFDTYRLAHPDPEPSANFTPMLWERIEARRSANVFRRFAQVLVPVSAAAAFLLGFVLIPRAELPGGSYADVVAVATAEAQYVAAAAPLPVNDDEPLEYRIR